jgi:hypothetical protein
VKSPWETSRVSVELVSDVSETVSDSVIRVDAMMVDGDVVETLQPFLVLRN